MPIINIDFELIKNDVNMPRSFNGVFIETWIWVNKNLTLVEKCLLVEIDSLDHSVRHCFASNQYLSNFLGVSISTVTKSIKKLEEQNLIETTTKKTKTGTERQITSLIKTGKPTSKIKEAPLVDFKSAKDSTIDRDVTKVTYKENNNSLPKDFLKYVSIIKNTAINKGTFRTRINKPTKTILTVIDYLQKIRKGSFLKLKINQEWIKTQEINTSRIIGITSDIKLEKLLVLAFTRFNTMKTDPEYWPLDKKNLQSMSLPSFFYNPISGKSWFLKCLSSRPELLQSNIVEAKLKQSITGLEKMEPNIRKLIEKIYNKEIINKWATDDKLAFYCTIRDLLDWRVENKELLKKNNEGWGTHFGSISKLIGTIGNFIDTEVPRPFPRFLQPQGYNWKKFIYWCKDYIGVELKSKGKISG